MPEWELVFLPIYRVCQEMPYNWNEMFLPGLDWLLFECLKYCAFFFFTCHYNVKTLNLSVFFFKKYVVNM